MPYLEKLAHIIESRVEDLAYVETTNNGSLLEASRLRVMKRGAHNIHHFAEMALQMGKNWDTEPAKNAVNSVRYDPAGVTALITPWNAPFMLATWKVGPALAAGNTVVLKPAEWTPLTASLLADFVLEAGLPAGVFNVVQGLVKKLVQHWLHIQMSNEFPLQGLYQQHKVLQQRRKKSHASSVLSLVARVRLLFLQIAIWI